MSYLPKKVLESIYNGYIYSILNYGIIIWGGAYTNALKQLISIQEKFIKLLKSENIPKIEILYRSKCVLHHYKTLSTKFSVSNSKTRNKSISLPKYSKTITQKNSLYTATYFFNKLPNEFKMLNGTNKEIMKKLLECLKKYE